MLISGVFTGLALAIYNLAISYLNDGNGCYNLANYCYCPEHHKTYKGLCIPRQTVVHTMPNSNAYNIKQ